MKSKWTTYVLLAGVLAIWGLIAWRIFFKQPEAAVSTPKPPAANARQNQPDTLLLDYDDPFLGKTQIKKERTPAKTIAASRHVQSAPEIRARPPMVHNVKYIGSIKKKGVSYCLAEIDGKFISLAVGETEGEYELVKIYADSAGFMKDKELFTVKVSQ